MHYKAIVTVVFAKPMPVDGGGEKASGFVVVLAMNAENDSDAHGFVGEVIASIVPDGITAEIDEIDLEQKEVASWPQDIVASFKNMTKPGVNYVSSLTYFTD